MSTPDRKHRRRHTAGTYLTDEVFLYRVVGTVSRGTQELVEVEDCYRLDVVHVPAHYLRARQLHVVAPSRHAH